MKRTISFALILIMLLSLAACTGGQTVVADPTAAPTNTVKVTPEPTEAPTEAPTEEPTAEPTVSPTEHDVPFPEDDPAEGLPKIYAGTDVFFILYPDGNLYGWGNNEHGQLGINSTENKTQPVHIAEGLTPVIVGETCFALGPEGILWGWGRNDRYQLGTGSTGDVSFPQELMYNVTDVYYDFLGYYALTTGGELYSWSYPEYNSLTSGEISERSTPRLIAENVKYYDEKTLCYVTNSGEVWRYTDEGYIFVADGVSRFWGYGVNVVEGQDGKLYEYESNGERTLLCDSFKSVTVSDNTAYIIKDDGSLWKLRFNLSNISGEAEEMHTMIFLMDNVREFWAESYIDEDWGYDYKFALKNNGDLWSWGYYSLAALGKTQMSTPWEPECVAHEVRTLVTNGMSAYILTFDGAVWATGLGPEEFGGGFVHGGLGDGSASTRFGFVLVIGPSNYPGRFGAIVNSFHMGFYDDPEDGTDWCELFSRTFVIDRDGNILAWGFNGDGFLGVGSTEEEVLEPTEVYVTRD